MSRTVPERIALLQRFRHPLLERLRLKIVELNLLVSYLRWLTEVRKVASGPSNGRGGGGRRQCRQRPLHALLK